MAAAQRPESTAAPLKGRDLTADGRPFALGRFVEGQSREAEPCVCHRFELVLRRMKPVQRGLGEHFQPCALQRGQPTGNPSVNSLSSERQNADAGVVPANRRRSVTGHGSVQRSGGFEQAYLASRARRGAPARSLSAI